MIIACPACHTKYAVPDNAISIEGRTVRCAKCKHSWFQDGPHIDAPSPAPDMTEAEPAEKPAARNDPEHSIEPPEEPHPQPAPVAATPAPSPKAPDHQPEPPVMDRPDTDYENTGGENTNREDVPVVDSSEMPATTVGKPRRNPARMWTLLAIGFAALAILSIAAVSYFGLPAFLGGNSATFAEQEPDLIIEFPIEKQERRRAPSGTEYFAASGTVVNTGTTTQKVPDMLIVLRDARGRIVYNWEVKAPVDELGPGERANFNEAVVDIPRSATLAEIGWSPSG